MAADDHKLRSITSLSDLRPGMKNVTCVFIVIDKGTTNQTKDGSIVRKCRVADRTGSIMFSLWNEQADAIEEGDILRLTKGYASLWKGGMVLYSGKYGILEKIGEFVMLYSESPDMSDTNQEFAVQASHQQYNRGQANPPSSSGPGRDRWTEGQHTNSNSRQGPAGNRNGNNHTGHTVATEHGQRNEGTNHQTNWTDNQLYSSHSQPQPKPLFNDSPGTYNNRRNTPPASFHEHHDQSNHTHEEWKGVSDRNPSRSMYEPSSYNNESEGHREKAGHWKSQSFKLQGEYPKERFHPYQRPQRSSSYHAPPNFVEYR